MRCPLQWLLALIADAMGIEKGGADVERIATRLGPPKGSTLADVHRRLKESKEFFVVLGRVSGVRP